MFSVECGVFNVETDNLRRMNVKVKPSRLLDA